MSQTQPEVRVLMEDIFGSDSEDENDEVVTKERKVTKKPLDEPEPGEELEDELSVSESNRKSAPVIQKNTEEDSKRKGIFGDDSDDESRTGALSEDSENERTVRSPRGRLQKGSSGRSSKSKADIGLVDSDAEDEPTASRKKPRTSRKRVRPGEKEGPDAAKERVRNRIKRGSGKKTSKRSRTDEGEGGGEDDGDAYDSGEEVRATKDDIDFIDNENDEHADLVAEYERDNPQNFRDDEIDEGFTQRSKKSSKKASAAVAASSSENRIRAKDQDPLSQALLEMKKPKAQVLDDASKDRIVSRLQEQMAKAVELDAACVARQEPAMHKLHLLPALQRAVGMRALQQTLLDPDSIRGSILCNLRDWIEPRDARTLPALTVRSAVYNILLNQLNPSPEQLKKTAGRGMGSCDAPIGAVIVALRKHKMETPENKKILKDIIEKWSRPIFSKLADERSGKGFVSSAEEGAEKELQVEIRQALVQKYISNERTQSATASRAERGNAEQRVDVEAVLAGNIVGAEDPNKEYNRVNI